MERSDAELLEGIKKGDKASLSEVLEAFVHGDRGAYNLLVNLLKRSEPHAEQALRGSFAEGDGLVAELVCQAYYPFVEALCKYKFKEKNPHEITEITSRILGDFVKGATRLQPDTTMKNQLYQRVCSVYKEQSDAEPAEKAEPPADGQQASDSPQEKTAAETEQPESKPSDDQKVMHIENFLPPPYRITSHAKKQAAASAALEAAAAKAVAAAAASAASASKTVNVESVLPPLASEKKTQLPKLKGFPSDSHEAKTTGPHSGKMIKALSRMSERDFDTYQTIVSHYFGRKGYQQLCREAENRSLVDIGKMLCTGLLDLGREVFDK